MKLFFLESKFRTLLFIALIMTSLFTISCDKDDDGTVTPTTEDGIYVKGPATFNLGGVIRGWTEGLQLMSEGAKYKFYVPYALGYGAHDYGPIPGGSVLIFEVDLLKVIKSK